MNSFDTRQGANSNSAARDSGGEQRAELLQAQLAAIVESSSDGIIGKTQEGIITSWNKGAEKIYGYSAVEIIGKHVSLLAPASRQAEILKLMETVRNGGMIANYETERVRKDGARIDVALTLSPICDASGRVSGISTIARDITEHKRMEQERSESLRYFESMDKVNRAMQGTKDLEGMLGDVLNAVLDIFDCDRAGLVYPCDPESSTWEIVMERAKPGYSTEPQRGALPMTEIRAESMRMLLDTNGPVQFTPEDDPALARVASFGIRSFLSMAVHPRTGNAWEFGIHQCTRARTWSVQEVRLFEEIGQRLADGLNAMLVYRDLQQSEEKYRSLIHNIQAGVVVHAPNTQVLVSNPRAREILGLNEEQMMNKTAIDPAGQFFREDGNAAEPEEYPVNRVLLTHVPIRNVVMGVHRPNLENDVWVLVNADPVFSNEGEINQIIVSFTDISERRFAEEQLKRLNERFLLASRAAGLGVWDWNIRKDELIWDEGMYALYGIRREDFAGAYEAWLQGVHPDDRARSDEEIRLAKNGEREFDSEFRVVWPDGSVHFLKAYGQIVRDAKGNPMRMTGINFDISERRLAEDALRREQALMNRIMLTSPVGIAVVDREGKITFANPQAERILGLSREEITQRNYNSPEWQAAAIDGGNFPDEAQPFSRVMTTRQPVFDVQHAIVWPDGHRVLLSINGAPIFDAGGEIECAVFTIEDITQRRLAEEALRASARSLIEAQRIAHVGSWHMNLATNEVFWSEELYKIYGLDPAQPPPLYADSMKLFTPESWVRLSASIAKCMETGIPYELELETVHKEGGRGWMLARGELVRDKHGVAAEMRGVVMDISRRKQNELALLEQQRHSKSLLRLSRKLEKAQASADILDAAGEEVKGVLGYRNLWVYLLSEDRQYFTALVGRGEDADKSVGEGGVPRMTIAGDRMLEQIAQAKKIVIIEDAQDSDIVNKEIVRKLGSRTIVNIPITIFDRHLGSVGVGTFGDEGVRVPTAAEQKYLQAMASHIAVTLDRIFLMEQRKNAEEEVQTLNRDLERRVTERTSQLEAANNELEAFSYSVSHDLRAPLRAIDGFSHILLEGYSAGLDDEGKRLLNVVSNNAQRMAQLIDDILRFSRSGRTELAFADIDMERIARTACQEIALMTDDDIAQVEIGAIPHARGDSAMLRQVFVNLISNAIKFSRTREVPHIEVGATIEGSESVYYVKDNGVGFDMRFADKLFGMFQRLHGMEEFEGTGIGLAIVKRIITRHGGRVWAEGKTNEGATIYFALPGREANAA